MAKRYKPYRTRGQRVWRGALKALVLLALAAAFAVEAFGGRYGIPTWGQLYRALGVPLETADPAAAGSAVTVTVLDVGQGDAVLLAQNGEYCLIDAGTSEGSEALCAALDRMGVRRLKLLVLTHPHADHSGGMVQILREFPVEALLLPPVAAGAETPWTLTLLTTVAENHGAKVLTAETGQTHAVGQGTLTVLQAGFAGSAPGAAENTVENDASLCLRYTAGDFAFLDTGDAEAAAEEALTAAYKGGLQATLMKAGHHGSSSSNTAALLRAASPRRVAISCGVNNEYGHPHDVVLRRLQQFDIPYDRTDTAGTLTYLWQDGELTVLTAGKEAAAAQPAA